VKVLMYLASMSTRKTSTNSQIFQHNDVFHNFLLDRSCLSHRDWVQDVNSKYGIGKLWTVSRYYRFIHGGMSGFVGIFNTCYKLQELDARFYKFSLRDQS